MNVFVSSISFEKAKKQPAQPTAEADCPQRSKRTKAKENLTPPRIRRRKFRSVKMRFNIFDKFLLVLLLLCVIALSALCVATAMGFVTFDMITAPIEVITNGLIGNRLILGGGGVVLLAIAFRLFVAMGKKRDAKNAAASAPTSTMIMSGDNGTAYMTISAIDSLVQRHCRANAKVKECESVVVPAASLPPA